MKSEIRDTIAKSLLKITGIIHEAEFESMCEPEILDMIAEISIDLIEYSNLVMYHNTVDLDKLDSLLESMTDERKRINQNHIKQSYIDLISKLVGKLSQYV